MPNDYDEKEGARFEVKFEKSRGVCGEAVNGFEAQLFQKGEALCWDYKDIKNVRLSQAIELAGLGLSVREIAEEIGISKSAAHRLLKK